MTRVIFVDFCNIIDQNNARGNAENGSMTSRRGEVSGITVQYGPGLFTIVAPGGLTLIVTNQKHNSRLMSSVWGSALPKQYAR